jgi:exopolyphosphatase/guanosine-5'-triphosphate,3'-diphosphate pyrophosphatase
MDNEGRATGDLDLGLDRPRTDGRVHRGRGGHFRHRRAVQSAGRRSETYAALDLGTNNCRLLIAHPPGTLSRIEPSPASSARGRRIGDRPAVGWRHRPRGGGAQHLPRQDAKRAATRARLIATEASRAAANGAEFLEVIRERVGIDLEIVDRETEADLAATGCTPLIDPQATGVVLFDIGGGSSELVLLAQSEPARRGPPKPVVRSWVSLPVGVVTLAERHGGMRVDRTLFEVMVAEVAVHAAPFTSVLAAPSTACTARASGTVTTIAHPSRPPALRPAPGRRLLAERDRGDPRDRPAARHDV